MNSLFENRLEGYTSGTKTQATVHQGAAIKAWETLGDAKEYLPQYLAIFKRAGGMVDLSELVAKAKGKDNPGSYFLAAARRQLGISRKETSKKA